MSNISLIELKAGERQKAEDLAALAKSIWREHYTSIIGQSQVEYMLDKFQSADQILKDIETDEFKYFITNDGAVQVQ